MGMFASDLALFQKTPSPEFDDVDFPNGVWGYVEGCKVDMPKALWPRYLMLVSHAFWSFFNVRVSFSLYLTSRGSGIRFLMADFAGVPGYSPCYPMFSPRCGDALGYDEQFAAYLINAVQFRIPENLPTYSIWEVRSFCRGVCALRDRCGKGWFGGGPGKMLKSGNCAVFKYSPEDQTFNVYDSSFNSYYIYNCKSMISLCCNVPAVIDCASKVFNNIS